MVGKRASRTTRQTVIFCSLEHAPSSESPGLIVRGNSLLPAEQDDMISSICLGGKQNLFLGVSLSGYNTALY
jgi:hypothetical protein